MDTIKTVLTVLVAAVLIGGCAGKKEPATQAVAAVEASINSIRADAQKYASDGLQQAENALSTLKDTLNKGDYEAVLGSAPSLSNQVAALGQTVATKKSEAEAAMAAASQEWQALSADVPQMISAVQSRVDMLSQSSKLPKNLTADTFKSAQDGLGALKSTWAEATAAFGSGNPVEAVSKARVAKQKATEVMQTLGMG